MVKPLKKVVNRTPALSRVGEPFPIVGLRPTSPTERGKTPLALPQGVRYFNDNPADAPRHTSGRRPAKRLHAGRRAERAGRRRGYPDRKRTGVALRARGAHAGLAS